MTDAEKKLYLDNQERDYYEAQIIGLENKLELELANRHNLIAIREHERVVAVKMMIAAFFIGLVIDRLADIFLFSDTIFFSK